MNNKNKKRNLRDALGLPDDNGRILGVVSEDSMENCENTISNAEPLKRIEQGFFYGASGGATSPNTEVNAENQGVISEVPKKV